MMGAGRDAVSKPDPMADLTGLFTHTKSLSEAKCFIFPPEYI